ncbi:hypothetical protein [Rubrolithibacter danxiaensis]|uniref:hypothetical protein n=1 Tax=Rubrolithibacter danxiaensis TaxID=3390805 RepID=UPI003BF77E0F
MISLLKTKKNLLLFVFTSAFLFRCEKSNETTIVSDQGLPIPVGCPITSLKQLYDKSSADFTYSYDTTGRISSIKAAFSQDENLNQEISYQYFNNKIIIRNLNWNTYELTTNESGRIIKIQKKESPEYSLLSYTDSGYLKNIQFINSANIPQKIFDFEYEDGNLSLIKIVENGINSSNIRIHYNANLAAIDQYNIPVNHLINELINAHSEHSFYPNVFPAYFFGKASKNLPVMLTLENLQEVLPSRQKKDIFQLEYEKNQDENVINALVSFSPENSFVLRITKNNCN